MKIGGDFSPPIGLYHVFSAHIQIVIAIDMTKITGISHNKNAAPFPKSAIIGMINRANPQEIVMSAPIKMRNTQTAVKIISNRVSGPYLAI